MACLGRGSSGPACSPLDSETLKGRGHALFTFTNSPHASALSWGTVQGPLSWKKANAKAAQTEGIFWSPFKVQELRGEQKGKILANGKATEGNTQQTHMVGPEDVKRSFVLRFILL